jgi:hypothetical protein
VQRANKLQARVEALQHEMDERVAAAHRQYKHELVPLRNTTVVRFDTVRK